MCYINVFNNFSTKYSYIVCDMVAMHEQQEFIMDIICDRILENSSKSHMKSSVFLHVFNDISTYVYLFTEYFLHSFSN